MMTNDVTRLLGAVTREVASREYDGRPARVVAATRTYDATPDDLWDALTNAERIPRWFLPITGDLRLGGRYQLTGNAGGQITACDPPRHLAVTWEIFGQVSWVVVQLSADDRGGTRLRLEHIAPATDESWDTFGPGAAGVGWEQALMALDRHVETRAGVDSEAAMAWLMSDEGKSFIRQSSDGWGAASIAAGAAPEAARAAAARTAAFYTGEDAGQAKG